MPEAQAELFKKFFLEDEEEDPEECLKNLREGFLRVLPKRTDVLRRRAIENGVKAVRIFANSTIREWDNDPVIPVKNK